MLAVFAHESRTFLFQIHRKNQKSIEKCYRIVFSVFAHESKKNSIALLT